MTVTMVMIVKFAMRMTLLFGSYKWPKIWPCFSCISSYGEIQNMINKKKAWWNTVLTLKVSTDGTVYLLWFVCKWRIFNQACLKHFFAVLPNAYIATILSSRQFYLIDKLLLCSGFRSQRLCLHDMTIVPGANLIPEQIFQAYMPIKYSWKQIKLKQTITISATF